MKFLVSLCSLVLVLGFAAPAHAYRINVLDPPPGQSITAEPFTFMFTRCTTASHAGCFYGQNDTNGNLQTLELTFPNTAIFTNNSPTCSASLPANSLFTNCQTSIQNGYQIWFFSGGSIPTGSPANQFLIREEGIDPGAGPDSIFPTGTATSPTTLTVPGTVPEPSSIALLSTGLLLGGFFFARRRGLTPASLTANR